MKIKTALKKLKRGDVVSIDWIDSGDIEDSSNQGQVFAFYHFIARLFIIS